MKVIIEIEGENSSRENLNQIIEQIVGEADKLTNIAKEHGFNVKEIISIS